MIWQRCNFFSFYSLFFFTFSIIDFFASVKMKMSAEILCSGMKRVYLLISTPRLSCCRPFCPVLFYLLLSTLFFTALITHTIDTNERRRLKMFVCDIPVKIAGNFNIAIINSSSSSKSKANSSNRTVCKTRASNRCLSNG